MKSCASPSNLWGSVSTVIGCSITSWFLIMIQFQVRRCLKGTYHTALTTIVKEKSATRSHRLTSRRPQTRTQIWEYRRKKVTLFFYRNNSISYDVIELLLRCNNVATRCRPISTATLSISFVICNKLVHWVLCAKHKHLTRDPFLSFNTWGSFFK